MKPNQANPTPPPAPKKASGRKKRWFGAVDVFDLLYVLGEWLCALLD